MYSYQFTYTYIENTYKMQQAVKHKEKDKKKLRTSYNIPVLNIVPNIAKGSKSLDI